MTSEKEVSPGLHSEQEGPHKIDYNDNTNIFVALNSMRGVFSACTVIHSVLLTNFHNFSEPKLTPLNDFLMFCLKIRPNQTKYSICCDLTQNQSKSSHLGSWNHQKFGIYA